MYGGPAEWNVMWDLERRMRESLMEMFSPDNFRGQKYFKWGRVVTPRLLVNYFN